MKGSTHGKPSVGFAHPVQCHPMSETSALPRPRRRFKTNLRLLVRRPLVLARKYRWPLLALLVGAALDAVTTYVNLRRFGLEIEVHPAARLFWQICGTSAVAVALAKLVQAACAAFVACFWRTWCGWLMLAAGVLYALAAVSNHFLLL